MEKIRKPKKVFVQGPISPMFITESIASHQSKTQIGAHAIFLGQIRADKKETGVVTGIEYSAYEEMAEEAFHQIRETAFTKFELTCMHIYHSLGVVPTGEISLFVFVSSPHRRAAFEASEFIVEEIKANVPIFGKELVGEVGYVWKENK
ncbi:molybdenum cofactor biosynthesis protein MoaE [Dyadobacter psychrotolerans]|uniref:Molybdopterin synthase catalytic subunit n=1 Tax=Dyadobacter psychrotolerans TaxID=2541721 RepID=A0A4R5DQT9_9BACT|nr:molybdenum cofactor biosynthesis protein MoaE [Dyadobacter psychrotolerans]TDE13163.1 molybdenum cofactor biosynthesis protein MoaE [Dyadobacter psychrotolerans]